MPNWCEGNLRLRGTRAAILEFIKNEIEVVGHPKGLGIKSFVEGPSSCSPEILDEYGEVTVKVPEPAKDWVFLSMYIKGTRRNFIETRNDFYIYLIDEVETEDVQQTVCIDNFKAAWGFEAQPYVEKAKKYGIDIKIVGFERGMEFAQIIEIVGGELIKDQEIKFDDWNWECVMPNMGG